MSAIASAEDLGREIRAHRNRMGWDQARLAAKVGVSRQWVIEIEKGKPRAELQLVLRTLQALGLSFVVARNAASGWCLPQQSVPAIDIDRIVGSNTKPGARILPALKKAGTGSAQGSAPKPQSSKTKSDAGRRKKTVRTPLSATKSLPVKPTPAKSSPAKPRPAKPSPAKTPPAKASLERSVPERSAPEKLSPDRRKTSVAKSPARGGGQTRKPQSGKKRSEHARK